jgi:hypothetical protein
MECRTLSVLVQVRLNSSTAFEIPQSCLSISTDQSILDVQLQPDRKTQTELAGTHLTRVRQPLCVPVPETAHWTLGP